MKIRQLNPDDFGVLGRLIAQAGWNQTDRDIARLLAFEPNGCFAACEGGNVVGTTTTTTYGTDLAWVGMVLVDPEHRCRGIATALMEKALGYLREREMRTIKLDAPPEGQPVYERYGFVRETVLERWTGTELPAESDLENVRLGTWDGIAATDRASFGADRLALMQALFAEVGPPIITTVHAVGVSGFAFARPGRRATYVGPVVAGDVSTVAVLLIAVAAGLGPVFIDIDPDFPGAVDLMRDFGFVRQRELLRMRLGPTIPLGQSPRVFAIAGPEVG